MISLDGTGVALVTPFKKDLSIDFEALNNLIDFNLKYKINYFVVLGTTAETATLNKEEKKLIINFITKKINKKIPLILGIASNNTYEIIKELESIDLTLFSALLSVCPYYNKPNQKGIFEHYRYIAQRINNFPLIIYNVPSRSVVNINVETTVALAKTFSNIIAIKEASPNFIQSLKIIQQKPSQFKVLSGDDDLSNSQILAGASGVISVLAQAFPKEFTMMIDFALNKKVKESYEIYYNLLNIMFLIFKEGSPSGIKCVLSHLNIIKPYVRLPLVKVSKDLNDKIIIEIKKILNTNIIKN